MVSISNVGMQQTFRHVNRGLSLCHLALVAAAALAITGGAQSDGDHGLRKGSATLLLVVFLILIAAIAGNAVRMEQVWMGDRLILYASVASFPFLLVRVIYSLCTAFITASSAFSPSNPNVYVEAFMVCRGAQR